ncbi:hypothetical protein OK016_29665 [Vibrio chagasii]|nr:hypothetical protein [Vibrio chagasii]
MAAYVVKQHCKRTQTRAIHIKAIHLAGPLIDGLLSAFLAYIKSVRKMRFFTDTAAKH